jgi:hypothetical protein
MNETIVQLTWRRSANEREVWQLLRRTVSVLQGHFTSDQAVVDAAIDGSPGRVEEVKQQLELSGLHVENAA